MTKNQHETYFFDEAFLRFFSHCVYMSVCQYCIYFLLPFTRWIRQKSDQTYVCSCRESERDERREEEKLSLLFSFQGLHLDSSKRPKDDCTLGPPYNADIFLSFIAPISRIQNCIICLMIQGDLTNFGVHCFYFFAVFRIVNFCSRIIQELTLKRVKLVRSPCNFF